jgi:hypothetical protein
MDCLRFGNEMVQLYRAIVVNTESISDEMD